MVQGELLTAHPGGVHGYGWPPGGGSASRQGAGAAYPGIPDLETAVAAVKEKNGNSRSILGVSSAGTKYRPKGTEGGHRAARRVPGAPQGGRARDPSGGLVGPLPSLWFFGKLPGR